MQVSSKHLAMASPVFKAMLSHGFSEGEALQTQGTAEIPLPDDDPAAMAILLEIIHTRGQRVPRKVSLTLLALLAIGIDKYQLQDASKFYADVWLNFSEDGYDNLFNDIGSDLISQLMLLTVSWIFRKPCLFNMVTANLIRDDKWCKFEDETKVPGTDQVLPLPMIVLGIPPSRYWGNRLTFLAAIRKIREEAIAKSYSHIEKRIQMYTSPSTCGKSAICPTTNDIRTNRKCDSMVLGSIIQGVSNRLSVWPDPGAPYNFSPGSLKKEINALEIYSVCGSSNAQCLKERYCVKRPYYLNELEVQQGLNLKDYCSLVPVQED